MLLVKKSTVSYNNNISARKTAVLCWSVWKYVKRISRRDFTPELIYLKEMELKVTRSQTEELDRAVETARFNCQQMLRHELGPDMRGMATFFILTEAEECVFLKSLKNTGKTLRGG